MSGAIISQALKDGNKNESQNNSQLKLLEFPPRARELTPALEFLAALSDAAHLQSPPHFCFQVFSNITTKGFLPSGISPGKARHVTRSFGSAYKGLRHCNQLANGGFCGIYVTVNETDGLGRKKTNITRLRTLFVELDHGGLTLAHADEMVKNFGASIVVESSPGKYHIYWLLKTGSPGTDREAVEAELGEDSFEQQYTDVQHWLQYRFRKLSAGVESSDVSRVLRLPGFYHLKDPYNPFQVRLHHCDADCRYTIPEALSVAGVTKDLIKEWEGSDDYKEAEKRGKKVLRKEVFSAVDKDHGEYLGAGEGSRNEAMYHYVYNTLLKHKGLNLQQAIGVALVANQTNQPPLKKNEVITIVKSAWSKFESMGGFIGTSPGDAAKIFEKEDKLQKRDRKKKKFGDSVDTDEESLFDSTELVLTDADEDILSERFQFDYDMDEFVSPVSDASVVERIRQRYGHRLRVNSSMGIYWYQNGLWHNSPESKKGEQAFRPFLISLLSQVVDEPYVQRDACVTDSKGARSTSKISTLKKDMLSATKMNQVMKELNKCSGLYEAHDSFDHDRGKIACKNGVVDLKTGERLPHSPHHKFTRTCGVMFDSAATCPRWERFIEEIMGEDEDLVDYMQKICGVVLAGDTSIQSLFLLYGTGGNGKSIFIGVLEKLLHQFAGTFHSRVITKGTNNSDSMVSSELAAAYGKRLIAVSEVNEGDDWDESLVKSLSGEDRISAKYLYQNTFHYEPTYIVMVRANHKPIIRGSDAGIWARFRLVPFMQNFRGTLQQDSGLRHKLEAELSGIFNYCVEGYRKYLAEGLGEPEAARLEKEDYQREMNPVRAFVAELCEMSSPQEGMEKTELLDAYNRWAQENSVERMTFQKLGRKLKSMGIREARLIRKSSRIRTYNIRLTNEGAKEVAKMEQDKVIDFPV